MSEHDAPAASSSALLHATLAERSRVLPVGRQQHTGSQGIGTATLSKGRSNSLVRSTGCSRRACCTALHLSAPDQGNIWHVIYGVLFTTSRHSRSEAFSSSLSMYANIWDIVQKSLFLHHGGSSLVRFPPR